MEKINRGHKLSMSDRTTLIFKRVIGVNPFQAEKIIERQRLLLTIDPDWAHTYNGQAIMLMALNLLARLEIYSPKMEVVIPSNVPVIHRSPLLNSKDLKDGLSMFVASIDRNKRITFERSKGLPDIVLSVGTSQMLGEKVTLFVTSDGWLSQVTVNSNLVKASYNQPNNQPNAIGAYTAAALAVGEVFKWLILPFIKGKPNYNTCEDITFSTFDYSVGDKAISYPPLPEEPDLGDIILVGAGGLASAFIMTMAGLEDIKGSILIIDGDVLEAHSLNRHLISTWKDVKPRNRVKYKVVQSKDFLKGLKSLKVRALSSSYQKVEKTQIDPCPIVIVTVDDEETRLAIQSDMPKVILLGGYRDLAWSVARSNFINSACINCFTSLQITGNPEVPAASISFVSTLPGVLLVGELLKERYWKEPKRPPLNHEKNLFVSDTSRIPDQHSLILVPKVCPSCQNEERLNEYRAKWQ